MSYKSPRSNPVIEPTKALDSLTGRVTFDATPIERMDLLRSQPATVFTDEVATVRQTDPTNMLTSQDRLGSVALSVLNTLEDVFEDFSHEYPGAVVKKTLHEVLPLGIRKKIGPLALAPTIELPKVSVGDMITYAASRRRNPDGVVTWNLHRTDTNDEGGFIICGTPTKPATKFRAERPGHNATILGRNLDTEPTTEDVGEEENTRRAVANLTHSAIMFTNDYAAFWPTGQMSTQPWQRVVSHVVKKPVKTMIVAGAVILTPTVLTNVMEIGEDFHDFSRFQEAGNYYHADANGIPYTTETTYDDQDNPTEQRTYADVAQSPFETFMGTIHNAILPFALYHVEKDAFLPGIQSSTIDHDTK